MVPVSKCEQNVTANEKQVVWTDSVPEDSREVEKALQQFPFSDREASHLHGTALPLRN